MQNSCTLNMNTCASGVQSLTWANEKSPSGH
nr:MAG TPA: hypothetical protein [Caudoviricetes sp.]